MHDPDLHAALERGATVVTPNKRLAREIAARHDRAQVAAGKATWPAARVMPWIPFVRELIQLGQDAGLALPPVSLDAIQTQHLWQRVVRADLATKPLIDAQASAALAADAWDLVHGYGPGHEGWRGFTGGEDVEAFVRWADAYTRQVARMGAIDAARAADGVSAIARELPGVKAFDILLAGFVELSPQQRRLVSALEAAGARIAQQADEVRPIAESHARVVECETSRDELASALDWARHHALRDSEARVGIVVLDLAARRAEVRSACEGRLCAPLEWPGRHEDIRPYDISLGPPLAEAPLVATALTLIALSERPIERSRAATLMRSPYLPGDASGWLRRAALERLWLERGAREIAWSQLVDDVRRVDANLAARWEWATGELRRQTRLSPRACVERWREWLSDVGWCDGRALSSAEYQADAAWNELLSDFARLTAVAPTLTVDEALSALHALASERVFQPEAPGARIRVLGLLEATGLRFDALWVAGMSAEAWPRSVEPNALLPLAWQRQHNVPRASADGELAFARAVTAQLAHSAREVVFSYAAALDEYRRTPSPLLGSLPRSAATSADTTAGRMFAARPMLESVADATAPQIAPGTHLRGGTGVVGRQSDCPFQATATYRLSAEPWPAATIGLTPIERGQLVHATLEAFWRAVGSHAALLAMAPESTASSIDAAFESARTLLTAARWQSLPPAICAAEKTCVARLVTQWVEGFDKDRPPFTVLDTERRTSVSIAGYTLDVRLDRVDALESGGVAVIDYKTGLASAPSRWLEARPQGVQIALYGAACEQAVPDVPVQALAYAQLRPGEMKAIGLAADASAWPALSTPATLKGADVADWTDARARLRSRLTELVGAFGAGDAAISPRDPRKVCSNCGLRALCRIGSLADDVPTPVSTRDDDD